MGVGRSVRTRKSVASALILVGAPIWLLGSVAFAQSAPKRDDWPALPPQQGPRTSRRIWPPPAPPRAPPADPSTEASPTPDDEASAAKKPPPPPAAPEPPPAPIDDPNQAAATPPPPPPAAPAPPHPPQPPQDGVYIELRSEDAGMRIDQLTSAGQSWPACGVPCRRVLQRNLTYVIESNNSPPTSPFLLPDNTTHLTLDVHPGSQTQSNVGTLLAIAGGVVALIGFVRLATGGNSPSSDHTGLELLAGGAATGITGLVIYRMGRTTVTSSTGMTFGEERPRDRRPTPSIALTPQGLVF